MKTVIGLIAAGRVGQPAYKNYAPQRIKLVRKNKEELTNIDEIAFPMCGMDRAIIISAYIADKHGNVIWSIPLTQHCHVDSSVWLVFAPGAIVVPSLQIK